MIFILLFFEFFILGLCAFGGGLATIPFLEDLSQRTGWFTLDDLANMIAISESTPGAIGINMSTYVGYTVGSLYFNGSVIFGFIGGVCATLGLVTPSIIIILIICQFLKKFRDSKVVQWAFYGLRAASIGLIGSAAYSILTISIINPNAFKNQYDLSISEGKGFIDSVYSGLLELFDIKCVLLAIVMAILIFKFKKHPILYIAIAAAIGVIFSF